MKHATRRPAPGSTRPVGRWSRFVCAAGVGLGVLLLGWAALARPSMDLAGVAQEHHRVIEWTQVGLWIVSGIAAAIACLRQRARVGLRLAVWLGAVSVLAGLRELDLHVLLNPENIHHLGLAPEHAVHYRLDWWTDGSVPLGLKALWGAGLLAVAASVILPFALARYDWPRRLLRLERFPWLIALGFAGLAGGYVLDDLVGRPLESAGIDVGLGEEISEVIGQGFLLAGVAVLAARPIGSARGGEGEPGGSDRR